jgi:hypothetical protein
MAKSAAYVYVVFGAHGEYSERTQWHVAAFALEGDAGDLVQRLTAAARNLPETPDPGDVDDYDWEAEHKKHVARCKRIMKRHGDEDYEGDGARDVQYWMSAVRFVSTEES